MKYVDAFNEISLELVNGIGKETFSFASKEVLASLVSQFIIEDIKLLLHLKRKGFPQRHSDGIIRNICEQVIEFIYVIKKGQDLINEYFGDNLNESEINSVKDPIKGLLKFGKARFKDSRKAVHEMAIEINEIKDTKHKLSLYRIFSLKSDAVHNAYFRSIMEEVVRLEEELEEDNENDIDYMHLIYIIEAFKKAIS